MDALINFLFEQIGVQGVFFVFTLILAYVVYNEWRSDKKEHKEEMQKAIDREASLMNELKENREMLKKFSEKYDLIIDRLEELNRKIK